MNKLNWIFYSLYMACIVFLLQVYQALKMYASSFILLMYIILYSLNIFHWCRFYVHVKKKSWEGVLSRIPVKINRLSRYVELLQKTGSLGYPHAGLPLLWNQREKWLLFQVLIKEKWETTGRSGESTGRSQNISLFVPLFTFEGHYRGIRML
jgi:hypothetical protein